MIVAIHQLEFMPWTGFFHKMDQADEYIILDDVSSSQNEMFKTETVYVTERERFFG